MNLYQKIQACQDPNTSTKTLEILAADRSWCIREFVAAHPNTSAKSLELLAVDIYWIVRHKAARNPNRTELIERLVLMTDYKLSTATT